MREVTQIAAARGVAGRSVGEGRPEMPERSKPRRSKMLRNVREIVGAHVHAEDGRIGPVHTLYFDDEGWRVRHFVVGAGNLLKNRDVLLAPEVVRGEGGETERDFVLRSGLTKEEVEVAPGAVTDPPVAWQRRIDRAAALPYPTTGESTIGPAGAPIDARILDATGRLSPVPGEGGEAYETGKSHGDPHLRSTREVRGYRVRGRDGEIGHVEDFVVDTDGWAIRYVAVDTRNWLPGKKVLVASSWVLGVSWEDAEVSVDLDSIEAREASPWNPDLPVDRTYEEKIHAYYGRTPYWARGE